MKSEVKEIRSKFDKGNFEEAVEELLEALEKSADKDYMGLAVEIGDALVDMGTDIEEKGKENQMQFSFYFYSLALKLFEKLFSMRPKDEAYVRKLAIIHYNMGLVLSEMGRFKEAAEHYEKASENWKNLLRDHPENSTYKSDLADSLFYLGDSIDQQGYSEDAEKYVRQALNLWKELTEDFPSEIEYQKNLAATYSILSEILRVQDLTSESLDYLDKALDIWEELSETFPDEPSYKEELSITYYNMGKNLEDKGDILEAQEYYKYALTLMEELSNLYPENPDYKRNIAVICGALGNVFLKNDSIEKAESFFQREVEIGEELVRNFPQRSKYRQNLADGYLSLGVLAYNEGNLKKALSLCQRSVQIFGELSKIMPETGEVKSSVVISLLFLGKLLYENNKLSESKEAYLKGLKAALDLPPSLIPEIIPNFQATMDYFHLIFQRDEIFSKEELELSFNFLLLWLERQPKSLDLLNYLGRLIRIFKVRGIVFPRERVVNFLEYFMTYPMLSRYPHIEGFGGVGEFLVEVGNKQEGLSLLERFYLRKPFDPRAPLRLAKYYLEEGLEDKARSYLNEAQEKLKGVTSLLGKGSEEILDNFVAYYALAAGLMGKKYPMSFHWFKQQRDFLREFKAHLKKRTLYERANRFIELIEKRMFSEALEEEKFLKKRVDLYYYDLILRIPLEEEANLWLANLLFSQGPDSNLRVNPDYAIGDFITTFVNMENYSEYLKDDRDKIEKAEEFLLDVSGKDLYEDLKNAFPLEFETLLAGLLFMLHLVKVTPSKVFSLAVLGFVKALELFMHEEIFGPLAEELEKEAIISSPEQQIPPYLKNFIDYPHADKFKFEDMVRFWEAMYGENKLPIEKSVYELLQKGFPNFNQLLSYRVNFLGEEKDIFSLLRSLNSFRKMALHQIVEGNGDLSEEEASQILRVIIGEEGLIPAIIKAKYYD